MPKHVWKCSYCSESFEKFDDANIHEKQCSFNPLIKSCKSCFNYVHWTDHDCGDSYSCDTDLDINKGHKGNCEGWKNE